MSLPIVLITHFFNEEYLLPFFIAHYNKLVDRVIAVDFDSTDRSVELIRDLAPKWEIIKSKNKDFNAWDLDLYMMEIERGVEGERYCWVTNITEFLMTPDLHSYLDLKEEQGHSMIAFDSVVMVDHPAHNQDKVDKNTQLYFQKFHGYIDREHRTRRYRYIHRNRDGNYHIGRHGTNHGSVYDPNLLLTWWGWSPMNDETRKRKLQIQTRIPEVDKQRLLGKEHVLTPEQLEERYNEQVNMGIVDLRSDATYLHNLEVMKQYGFEDIAK
jgi:hypothetical protein